MELKIFSTKKDAIKRRYYLYCHKCFIKNRHLLPTNCSFRSFLALYNSIICFYPVFVVTETFLLKNKIFWLTFVKKSIISFFSRNFNYFLINPIYSFIKSFLINIAKHIFHLDKQNIFLFLNDLTFKFVSIEYFYQLNVTNFLNSSPIVLFLALIALLNALWSIYKTLLNAFKRLKIFYFYFLN